MANMSQPRSRYLAERRFRRQILIGRGNGLLLLLGAIICLILGEAQLAAGSVQGFLGLCFIAVMWGAFGIWMMRFNRRRRPHWLEIAVLQEQRERSREERSDGPPQD